MLIPYTYDPATQDLWLYEDYTVNVTVPSPFTIAAKRPIAWNPNSPLYGYRKSIQGITTRLRTFTQFCGNSLAEFYSTWNDPALAVNKPVFYNSYPQHFVLISDRFMFGCLHCFGQSGARNPAQFYVGNGGFTAGGLNDAATMFRWLDADNNVIVTRSPSTVLRGFTTDTGYSLQCRSDLALFELSSTVTVPPVTVVDPRNFGKDAKMWLLDSNHKIVRLKQYNSYVAAGVDTYSSTAVAPDGSTLPGTPTVFVQDSGSFCLVEIKPPSDWNLGDGILGVIAAHMDLHDQFLAPSVPRVGYEDLTAVGTLANSASVPTHLRDYCAARSSPMVALNQSWRQTALASQTVEQQILTLLQGI
jgi:hypothetical protein